MTQSIDQHLAKRPPSYFYFRPGTDGVDETFDILCRETGDVVASFHFWEERERCRRQARQFVAALNALYWNGGDLQVDRVRATHEFLHEKYCQPILCTSEGDPQ